MSLWWTEEFDYSTGAFLPRTGYEASNDDNLWNIYNDGSIKVLYSNFGQHYVVRDTASEDHRVEANYKTSTSSNTSIGGVVARVKDATHYLGFELVRHNGGVGGVETPENKYVFFVRDGSTHYEYTVAADIQWETFYDIVLDVAGDRVKVLVDDVVLFDQILSPAELAVVAGGTKCGAINFAGNANYNTLSAGPSQIALVWSEWDGSTEIPLTLEGIWDGSVVGPAGVITIT